MIQIGHLVTNIAYIVDQVDERRFHSRLIHRSSVVSCSVSHELFYRNIQPLVGDLVKLEYNFYLRRSKSRVHNIVDVLYSPEREHQLKIKTRKLNRWMRALKRLDNNYDSWTVEEFFGSQWDRLLYSNLGIITIKDLINTDPLTIIREVDGEIFYEMFEDLVKFFKRLFKPRYYNNKRSP